MRASLETLWREASPLKRALLAGVPALVIALSALGITFAVIETGGGSTDKAQALAPTVPADTATPVPTLELPSPTAAPTEPPASAGLQSGGGGGGGGGGDGTYTRVGPPAQNLTGPGPIQGTDMTLSIPSIGVNATVYSRTIGTNGVMGNPSGPWDVIWYDFAANGWSGLGGYPGQPGANAVFAGHVDYIRVGPAVFWSLRDLQPGDTVTVYTGNGPITYAIQWSRWAAPDEDFTGFVAQTGQDSITLVTCIGGFSGGHYSNRLIVRGVRV
jgi:LPXTG-site transpeptidase (sortase) family protein